MIRRLLIVATLGLAAAAPLAFAQDGPRGPRGPLRGLVKSLESVELTETQQAQLDEMVATLPTRKGHEGVHPRPENRPTPEAREAHHEARKQKRALILNELAKSTPDAAALHAAIDDTPRGKAPEAAHEALDQILAFHATLSDDQRTQWVTTIEQHAAERRGRGRRGRHAPTTL
ncbi:MAG: hypothetical protein AAGA48_33710 [Myxococcota bacterium]